MTETRVCRYAPCSKEFMPTHWRQEFCEPKCRNDNHYLTHPEKGRRLGPDGVLRLTATQATKRRPSRDGKGAKVYLTLPEIIDLQKGRVRPNVITKLGRATVRVMEAAR